MTEVEKLLLVAFGVALQVGAVRWAVVDWSHPLRERTPVDVDLMNRSMFGGVRSPDAVQAQFRLGPARSVTAFFRYDLAGALKSPCAWSPKAMLDDFPHHNR